MNYLLVVWAWAVCGAVGYALYTWVIGCYCHDDEAGRAVVAMFGPIGVVLMVVAAAASAYLFILGIAVEHSLKYWHKCFSYWFDLAEDA